jgi:hypothetical protein
MEKVFSIMGLGAFLHKKPSFGPQLEPQGAQVHS